MYFEKQPSKKKKRKNKRSNESLTYENYTTSIYKVNFKLNFILLFFVLLLIFCITTNINYFAFYILNFDLNKLINLVYADKDDLITFSIDPAREKLVGGSNSFGLSDTFLKILSL